MTATLNHNIYASPLEEELLDENCADWNNLQTLIIKVFPLFHAPKQPNSVCLLLLIKNDFEKQTVIK